MTCAFPRIIASLVLLNLSFNLAYAQVPGKLGYKISGMEAANGARFIELKSPISLDEKLSKIIRIGKPVHNSSISVVEFGDLAADGSFTRNVTRNYKTVSPNEIMIEIEYGSKFQGEVMTLDKTNGELIKDGKAIQFKPMKIVEEPLGLRTQFVGFNQKPAVTVLVSPLEVNGKQFNTVRFIKNETGNTFTVRLGRGVESSGQLILDEKGAMILKNVTAKHYGNSIDVLEISPGNHLELHKDHVLFNGDKIDSYPFTTYRKGSGYKLVSNFKPSQVSPELIAKLKAGELKPVKTTAPKSATKPKMATYKSLGIMAFNIATTAMSFIPQNNPFAVVKGFNCADLAKSLNKIRCEDDSPLNPFNKVINCSEILESWRLADKKVMCGAKIRYYSFRVEKESGQEYLESNGFMSGHGSGKLKNISLKERKTLLKGKLGTNLIETSVESVPEHAEYL